VQVVGPWYCKTGKPFPKTIGPTEQVIINLTDPSKVSAICPELVTQLQNDGDTDVTCQIVGEKSTEFTLLANGTGPAQTDCTAPKEFGYCRFIHQ
jgi:hypothetical protein